MKLCFLSLEYLNWRDSSRFTYECNFGLEEGFEESNIDFLTIPIFYDVTGRIDRLWQKNIFEYLRFKQFDQIWFEVVHTRYNSDLLDWIIHAAPVRIGIIYESSEIHPIEWDNNRAGTQRRVDNKNRNLPAATHVIAVDEKDVDQMNEVGKQPAVWWCGLTIPRRFVVEEPMAFYDGPATFFGNLYGKRRNWIENHELTGLLKIGVSQENDTVYPENYERLCECIRFQLSNGYLIDEDYLHKIIHIIRDVRKKTYPIWLRSLSTSNAVVNLPQFGKIYASRVKQGMAVGRPVVSWKITEREKTQNLFQHGKEILLYDSENPDELVKHLKMLRNERALGQYLAENALRKIRKYHTTEEFVANVQDWIRSGKSIDYGI